MGGAKGFPDRISVKIFAGRMGVTPAQVLVACRKVDIAVAAVESVLNSRECELLVKELGPQSRESVKPSPQNMATRRPPSQRVRPAKPKSVDRAVWKRLGSAYSSRCPISGRVTAAVKGGLLVDIGVQAFLPASLADRLRVADLQSLVGLNITARIIDFDPNSNRIVLSRKEILEAEHERRLKELRDTLVPGQERSATIQSVRFNGLVVDLGGMVAWVPRAELCLDERSKVESSFRLGEEVTVTICDVVEDKIAASLRRIQNEPAAEELDATLFASLPHDPDPGCLGVVSGALTIDLGNVEGPQIAAVLEKAIEGVCALPATELNVIASSAQRREIRAALTGGALPHVDVKRCRQTATGFLLIVQPRNSERTPWLA